MMSPAQTSKQVQGSTVPEPEAEQLPLALVYGEALNDLPLDLYIPPDAL